MTVIHEVLVLPDGRSPELINAKSLGEMCANVNAEMVSPEETLSDKIAYYDGESRKLVNAAEYEWVHRRDMAVTRQKVM